MGWRRRWRLGVTSQASDRPRCMSVFAGHPMAQTVFASAPQLVEGASLASLAAALAQQAVKIGVLVQAVHGAPYDEPIVCSLGPRNWPRVGRVPVAATACLYGVPCTCLSPLFPGVRRGGVDGCWRGPPRGVRVAMQRSAICVSSAAITAKRPPPLSKALRSSSAASSAHLPPGPSSSSRAHPPRDAAGIDPCTSTQCLRHTLPSPHLP